jgi:hypothetical protein
MTDSISFIILVLRIENFGRDPLPIRVGKRVSIFSFIGTLYKMKKVEIAKPTTWKKFNPSMCKGCWAGCCTMPVQVTSEELYHMGFIEEPGIIEQTGDYKIVDGSSGKVLGNLHIDLARTVEQDDYLYAQVHDVSIINRVEPRESDISTFKENRVVLTGTLINSCMRIKEVKVSYHENSIILLPLVQYDSQLENCTEEKSDFTQEVVLDPQLSGEYLLHVRSLNGAAINKVIEFSSY